MKVRFLKDHLEYRQNDIAEVSESRGKYFIRVSVAENVIEKSILDLIKENSSHEHTAKPQNSKLKTKKATKPKAKKK